MLGTIKIKIHNLLRKSEHIFKTDMVYLARGSFWMNSNVIVVTGLGFLLSIAFAHLLPKETYGTYQFILSLGSILTALTLTGMSTAITQAVARGFEGSFKKSIQIQLKYGAIPFLVSVGIALYYFVHQNPTLALGIIIVGIFIPILNTFSTYASFIAGRKDFRQGFLYGQITNFSYYGVMILCLFFVQSAILLVIINLFINTLIAVILYNLTITKYHPNTNEDPATISFGKHLSLAGVFGIIANQLDKVLVFHFIGAAELAVYAFATNLPGRINGIMKGVSVAALPKFSERNEKELGETLLSKSLKLGFVSLIISIVYILLAPYIFSIFFPKYQASVFFSQIYALVLVVYSLSNLPLTALMATKSKKEMYLFNTISPIFNISIMFVMINLLGIIGLILARGISNIINFIILLFLFRYKKTTIQTN